MFFLWLTTTSTPQRPEGKMWELLPYFLKQKKFPEMWQSATALIWNKELSQFVDIKNWELSKCRATGGNSDRMWDTCLMSGLPIGKRLYLAGEGNATHSSTLAWKIPWMGEPGGLQSMGSWRVRYDWATSLSLFTFMHWRRKWQPTPVFLPGESQGRWSLVGCRLWSRTESDTTEAT